MRFIVEKYHKNVRNFYICQFIFASVCLYIFRTNYLFVWPLFYLMHPFIYPYICASIRLLIHLPIYLSIYPSIYISIHLPIYLSIYLVHRTHTCSNICARMPMYTSAWLCSFLSMRYSIIIIIIVIPISYRSYFAAFRSSLPSRCDEQRR